MIPRRKKLCKGCQTQQYLFGGGYCLPCYNRERAIERFKDSSDTLPPLKGKKRFSGVKKRSEKREEQEKVYGKIRPTNERCFFCDGKFKKKETPDRHHLIGRDGSNLTNPKYIVNVHRRCHAMYHDRSVWDIPWFIEYMKRVLEIDGRLYLKEKNKLEK